MIDRLGPILDSLTSVAKSKERNALLIQAKQNMLTIALINKAPAVEVEKARQELIDAMVAAIDEGIAVYKRTVELLGDNK